MAQASRTLPFTSAPGAAGAAERQRVLVVDRAVELVAALAAALGPTGEICCMGNADEALAAAWTQAPDLMLINVGVAEIDGFALAARLLADPRTRDTPTLLRGETATPAEEARGLRLGAIDFISGPANLELLALRIGNHLRRQRRHDQVKRHSTVDDETGLGNRRSLEDSLVREWHRAQRQGTALSLVLIDPQPAPPEGVKRIAQGLKSALHRPGDVVTRYGTHTFAAILTQTDAGGTEHVVARIRAAIGEAAIGAVTRVPQAGEDPVLLLRLADERLRRVKRAEAGRAP
jgi:PleD family two-component response regulator